MENWIVYDIATGLELYRGGGSPGSAYQQPVPPGANLAIVPAEVIREPVTNMAVLCDHVCATVDASAEAVRLRFVTAGSAMAGVYQDKAAEAKAYLADNTVPTPIMSGEAAGRGLTVAEVAAQVNALAEQWRILAGLIEGARLGAKDRVSQATTIGAMIGAGTVDWDTALAQPAEQPALPEPGSDPAPEQPEDAE